MDHMYAATAPVTRKEADHHAKPNPPFLDPCLHDHNFARPPSESPESSKHPGAGTRVRTSSNDKDEDQSSSTTSSGKRQPSPAKSSTAPSKAEPPPAKSSKLQTSGEKSLNVREQHSSLKMTRAQASVAVSAKQQPSFAKSSKRQPSPEKTTRDPPPEKTRTRQSSPEKTTKRELCLEKKTKRQPSPEKTITRQLSLEKTTKTQLSAGKTTKREPSPEKTSKRQLLPERVTRRQSSPEKSSKTQLVPAEPTKPDSVPTKPAGLSYPPKKRALRSLQPVEDGKSTAASNEEVNEDVGAVATLSAPNSPAGMRSISPGVIMLPVFNDTPAEQTLLESESESKQTDCKSQGENVNGPSESSSKQEGEQSEESSESTESSQVQKQSVGVDRSNEVHPQESVPVKPFPKVRSLLLSTPEHNQTNVNPVQEKRNTESDKKDSSQLLLVEIPDSNNSESGTSCNRNDATTVEQLCSDTAKIQHCCLSSGKNTSELNESSKNSATLLPASNESEKPEAVIVDQEIRTARCVTDKSDIPNPSQNTFTCIKVSEAVPTVRPNSPHGDIDSRFLEAVNLRKVTATTAKPEAEGQNGICKSTRTHLANRKRSAKAANLDGSQPQSGLSEGKAASAKKPSALSLALNQSVSNTKSKSSINTPLKSAMTASTSKKARLPKPDINKLPFDVTKFLVPMKEYGWRRELVMRGVFDDTSKRTPADVYYFTPQGKKLRSRVMIADYLAENPSEPLTVDNFTFYKQPIADEPYEIVRQAGKSKIVGRPLKQTPPKADVQPKSKPPKIPKVKIKLKPVGPGPFKTVAVVRESSKVSTFKRMMKSSHDQLSHLDEEEESVYSDDDEDYDPIMELKRPMWGRKKRRHKPKPKRSPERQVLIQSFPEPDIILDRAEETHLYDETSHRSGNSEKQREILIESLPLPEPDIIMDRAEETLLFDEVPHHSDHNENEETFSQSPAKVPEHMMLLPEDIKEEIDSDEEAHVRKNKDGDMGSVHLYRSLVEKPALSKPTARKSTMPRVALKKTRGNSSRVKESTPLSEGQLCSNACPGLDAAPPTLQCSVCMCLFHHQCVGVCLDQNIPNFKCLRCKDVPSAQTPSSPPLQESSSPKTTTIILKSVPASSTSISQLPVSVVQPSRFVYVHTPPGSAIVTTPFRQPLITMTSNPRLTATPQIALSAQPKIDAIQLLRKLGSAATSPPTAIIRSAPPPATPTAPPPTPPQLIRGGVVPPPLQSNSKLPHVPLRSRPPPRLTAAPGIVVSSAQLTPSSVVAASSSSIPSTRFVTPAQPQPQVMSLPASLLNQLNLSQPLAVKLNNTQVVVPPSCIISSADGLKSALSSVNMKVLLPPSTFPIPNDPNAKLSVTISSNSITNASISSQPAAASTTVSTTSKTLSRATQDTDVTDRNSSEATARLRTRKSQRQRNPVQINSTLCSMHRLFGGFDCMLSIFRFLGIRDLLRASLVCKTWHQIARQRVLWQRLDLKGLHVTHWDRATSFLHSVGTQTLSLPNIHHNGISNNDWLSFWNQVTNHLDSLTGVRSIEFGLVPSSVLHTLTEKLTWLEAVRAEHISDFCDEQKWTTKTRLDVGRLAGLTRLQELRLRGVSGLDLPSFSFSGSLLELANLKHLHTLSLTSLCALRDSQYLFLKDMKQLEVLELGDCFNWTCQTYSLLGDLHKLRHLRLVCGGEIPDIGIGEAIANLTNLERLELILFAIPATMESAFHQLPNLRTLVIWPHSSHGIMPAVVNSHAMTAVVTLKQLSTLTWGVVKQHSSPKDKSAQGPLPSAANTIPLLWPGTTLNPDVERDDSMIVDLSVTDFTKKLCESLPQSTVIKVLNTQVVGTEAV